MWRREFNHLLLAGVARSAAGSDDGRPQNRGASSARQGQQAKALSVSTSVTDALRPVSRELREALAADDTGDPEELTRSLPAIHEIEVSNSRPLPRATQQLRVVAWNMERGRYWKRGADLIKTHPALRDVAVLLLSEMDFGMARSGNVHTAKKMAAALGMNYAYGVEFLELTGGDFKERIKYGSDNDRGYHGNAILSAYALEDLKMVRFPGISKWFSRSQKRLGGRTALIATIRIPDPVVVVATHLEGSSGYSEMRRLQTEILVQTLEESVDRAAVVLGGDFNSRPDEAAIEALRNAGFLVDECNDLQTPTRQRIRNGKVVFSEAHIDYVALRGMEVIKHETSPAVIPAVFPPGSASARNMLGDHAIVTVLASA